MDQALQVVEEIKNFQVVKVVDEITREQAAGAIIELKTKRAQIVEFWRAPKENAHKAHQEIVSREKDMLKLVDNVIGEFDGSIKSYLRAQEEKRREEQRKLDEEARKKREADILAAQEKALAEGDVEKAIAIEDQAEPVKVVQKVAPMPQKTVKSDTGTSTATKDTFVEVTDFPAFFRYCAEQGIFNFHDVKIGEVKKWVKASGLKGVPGLRIYEDFTTQYRAAR